MLRRRGSPSMSRLEANDGVVTTEATDAEARTSTPAEGPLGACGRFCQSLTLIVLTVLVVILFVQVQSLQHQIQSNQSSIHHLTTEIQNQTQGQIHTLTQQVQEQQSFGIYQMAGTFCLLATLITVFHMSSHLSHFEQPVVQRKILAILVFCPIYALTSFFSLVWPNTEGYWAVLKDFYEAYVIYTFLSFLIAVLGKGERQRVVQILARQQEAADREPDENDDDAIAAPHPHVAKPPSRCLRRFYHPPPETSHMAMANAILTECQILTMQFVFVRPITSIARFVVEAISASTGSGDDVDENAWKYFASANFVIAMITNVSVFFAFKGLLKFYHATQDELAWCQPFAKFWAVKGIVFVTFWQGLAISIIVNLKHPGGVDGDENGTNDDGEMTPNELSAEIQNVLICVEMLFFSIAHFCVFPADEWAPDYKPKQYEKAGLGFKDFASDVNYIASSSSRHRQELQQSENGDAAVDTAATDGVDEEAGESDFPDVLATTGQEPYHDRLQQ